MSLKDDYIAQVDELLENYDNRAAESLVKEIYAAFVGEYPHIKTGLDRWSPENFDMSSAAAFDNRSDLEKLRAKLVVMRETEGRDAQDPSDVSGAVNVNVCASNQNAMYATITMSQLTEQIRSLSPNVLSDEEKAELGQMLRELESAKGKTKKDADGPLRKVLSWLADKGVDVGIAVIPFVAQILISL